MKNTLIALTLIATMASCEKEPLPLGIIIDVAMNISVKSAMGNDLLDANQTEHLAEANIKIFHLSDGIINEVYHSNADAVRGFFLFKHLNEYRIRVFGKQSIDPAPSITYIEWDEFDTDTLKYQVYRKNNSANISISKVWYNDKEVWDQSTSNDERFFEIVKYQ